MFLFLGCISFSPSVNYRISPLVMGDLSLLYNITSLNKVNVSENVLQSTYTVKMAKVVFSLHY